jgi:hypothetical protein
LLLYDSRPHLSGRFHNKIIWLSERSPLELRYAFGLWVLATISQFNEQAIINKPSLTAVYQMIRGLGFTAKNRLYYQWIRPSINSWQWKAKVFPAILAEARSRDATIYLADYSEIYLEGSADACLVSNKEGSTDESCKPKSLLNIFSVLDLLGNIRFALHKGIVNSEAVIAFLKQLSICPEHSVFVIMDDRVMHKAQSIRDFVKTQNDRLRLFYMPAP